MVEHRTAYEVVTRVEYGVIVGVGGQKLGILRGEWGGVAL